jgi:hypothetical protein
MKKLIILSLICLINVQDAQAMIIFGLFRIGGTRCHLGGYSETLPNGESYRGFGLKCGLALPIYMSCEQFQTEGENLLSPELVQLVHESRVCEEEVLSTENSNLIRNDDEIIISVENKLAR